MGHDMRDNHLTQTQPTTADERIRRLAARVVHGLGTTERQTEELRAAAAGGDALALAVSAILAGEHRNLSALPVPAILELRNIQLNYRGGIAVQSRLAQFREQGGNLAAEFFGEARRPVMLARCAHFSGDYPNIDHERTCKTRWMASGEVADGAARITAVGRVHFQQWRGYQTKRGGHVAACPHCQDARIRDYCEKIEKAATLYSELGMLRWMAISEEEAKRNGARIRKHNERNGRDMLLQYTTFPLRDDGRVVFLHDAAGFFGGEKLPSDRTALYYLVSKWALQTPKGKRAGHGLGTWGMPPAAAEDGQDDQKRQDGQGGGQDGQKRRRPTFRLLGENYGRMLTLLGAYLEEELRGRAVSLDIDAQRFIDFLEEAGIDYAIDGKLPAYVTLSRNKTKDISAKRDTAPPPVVNETPPAQLAVLFGEAQ